MWGSMLRDRSKWSEKVMKIWCLKQGLMAELLAGSVEVI